MTSRHKPMISNMAATFFGRIDDKNIAIFSDLPDRFVLSIQNEVHIHVTDLVQGNSVDEMSKTFPLRRKTHREVVFVAEEIR